VGSDNKALYCIYDTLALADTPWPKFRHDNRNSGWVGCDW
jgi:hypothetical protein